MISRSPRTVGDEDSYEDANARQWKKLRRAWSSLPAGSITDSILPEANLSQYEMHRLRLIQENHTLMIQLGLAKVLTATAIRPDAHNSANAAKLQKKNGAYQTQTQNPETFCLVIGRLTSTQRKNTSHSEAIAAVPNDRQ